MSTKKHFILLWLLLGLFASGTAQNSDVDSLYGFFFRDVDGDCVFDDFEEPMVDWTVTVNVIDSLNPGVVTIYTTQTDENGYYVFDFPIGTWGPLYVGFGYIQFSPPAGFGENCVAQCSTFNIVIPSNGAPSTIDINVGFHCDDAPPCPVINVNLGANFLRPCFPSNYKVHYFNNTPLAVADSYIEVTIDPALEVTGATIPYTSNGNVYTFNLGTINAFAGGDFEISVITPCDDPVGTTYCSTAHSFPDTCTGQFGPEWDGSIVSLKGSCEIDKVVFRLQNTGLQNMSSALEYIVVEDNVLLMQSPGQFQLDAAEVQQIDYPANGKFYRMEAEQSPGYPSQNLPVAWVEGCGTDVVSLGYVNQFSLGDGEPWLDEFCLESVNSYDPNDKQGTPRGVGAEGYIEANTDLEYRIRFQNTGTAPAVNVEIRDTLPVQYLDPASFRPGASSHAYTWNIEGNGVVVFRFNNINLPDSNANEVASHGFVQYEIAQHKDLPVGTQIKTDAAIYFDFNAPVITNQTLHTIGKDFLQVSGTHDAAWPELNVTVVPHPVSGNAQIRLEGMDQAIPLRFRLFAPTGQLLRSADFQGNVLDTYLGGLPDGLYRFDIATEGKVIYAGKLLKM